MTMVCDFNTKKIRKELEILEGESSGKIKDELMYNTIIVTCYDIVININKIDHDSTSVENK